MNSAETASEFNVKRVGKSGQISVGKERSGQYFREERRDDGAIILIPIAVLPKSHWTIRDRSKIRKALAWAAENPPRESNLDVLLKRTKRSARGARRG